MQQLPPKKVQLHKSKHELWLWWPDGSQTVWQWQTLRDNCPCATCREERKAPTVDVMQLDVFQLKPRVSADLQAVEAVGNYALRLIWADGHKTGLYGWPMLHRPSSEP